MSNLIENNFESIRFRKFALSAAIEKGRSGKWILRLWSRFIKERDLYRCVRCDSIDEIQAHHIVRRTLYPWGAVEPGNGITLCRKCHRGVHEKSNCRANWASPLDDGDDQDEWAFLFGLLFNDAERRNLDQDEFYFLSDHMLKFFANVQGYEYLYNIVVRGEISRIRFAYEIWRVMPEIWYRNFAAEIIRLNK